MPPRSLFGVVVHSPSLARDGGVGAVVVAGGLAVAAGLRAVEGHAARNAVERPDWREEGAAVNEAQRG